MWEYRGKLAVGTGKVAKSRRSTGQVLEHSPI